MSMIVKVFEVGRGFDFTWNEKFSLDIIETGTNWNNKYAPVWKAYVGHEQQYWLRSRVKPK